MTKETCFGNRRGRCTVLNVNGCKDTECSFYKTEAKLKEDRLKALKRIRSLDQYTRMNIIETYYKGNKKVLEEELL
jgi:hypothetical protein